MRKLILAGFTSLVLTTTQAADDIQLDTSLLKQNLQPGTEVGEIKESPIKGVYEVFIGGDLVYLAADGKTLITGEIYDLSTKTNLTEKAKSGPRLSALATVDEADKIVFKAANEKYRIDVFTDITCPYCTKLHNNMQAYNEAGITVRYLAYPRAGAFSDAGKDMQKIWCADDPQTAIGNAKNKKPFEGKECDKNQVETQFNLGNSIGVNATPTIILENGEIRPGYLDPAQMLEMLQSYSDLN